MARRRRLVKTVLVVGGLAIIGLMVLEIIYFMAPALLGAGLKRQLKLTLYVSPSFSGDAEDTAKRLAEAFNAGSHSVVVAGSTNASLGVAILYSKGSPVLVIVGTSSIFNAIASDRQLTSRLLDAALSLPDNETLVFIPGGGFEKVARNETLIEQLVNSILSARG